MGSLFPLFHGSTPQWQCILQGLHQLRRLNTHFSVVQEVGCLLQDAESYHAGSGADHEVVGVGVAALLLSLRPDCPRQQYVPLLDFKI